MPPSYVNPVPPGTQVMRMDQGQDYRGPVGGSVVAMGDATVDAVKSDPSGFGRVVYYTLLTGPARGQQIYVGHAQPVVSPGEHVAAGAPVATLVRAGQVGGNASQDGWTEIGLARGGTPQFTSGNTGGIRFQALLKDATLTPPAAPAVTAPVGGVNPHVPTAPAPTATVPDIPGPAPAATPDMFAGPPAPESTVPFQMAPGSGGSNDLWRLVSQQPNLSQDTLAYMQSIAGA